MITSADFEFPAEPPHDPVICAGCGIVIPKMKPPPDADRDPRMPELWWYRSSLTRIWLRFLCQSCVEKSK